MKNRFYVEEQPSKVILSVVLIDKIPVPEESHTKLFELQEVSDLLYIIPKNIGKGIVARKFGSLYRACCWVEAEGNLSECFLEALEYDKEIFGNHSLILVTSVSDITDYKGEELQKIAASSLFKPILQTRKLTSQEFFQIYKEEESRLGWMTQYLHLPISSPDLSNLYTTHTVISKEVMLRPSVINKMLNFWRSEKEDGFNGEGYVCSFTQPSLNFLLASLLKRLRTGEQKINPDEL